MAGLRIYFGNHDKSLIRRHREDDPQTRQELNVATGVAALGDQPATDNQGSVLWLQNLAALARLRYLYGLPTF
jgi:hypothetical protein